MEFHLGDFLTPNNVFLGISNFSCTIHLNSMKGVSKEFQELSISELIKKKTSNKSFHILIGLIEQKYLSQILIIWNITSSLSNRQMSLMFGSAAKPFSLHDSAKA